jgi:hypothetical protein
MHHEIRREHALGILEKLAKFRRDEVLNSDYWRETGGVTRKTGTHVEILMNEESLPRIVSIPWH